jgi:hypothetical protein
LSLRWLCLLAFPVLLSGCALPAAFTAASMAIDTGSYMMSGKTLTDHGLSLAMSEDCSMVRLLDEDDEICREEQHYEVADADLTPLPADSDLAIGLAADGEDGQDAGYAQLAQRVDRARTVYRQLADRANRERTGRVRYLAAGLMDGEG